LGGDPVKILLTGTGDPTSAGWVCFEHLDALEGLKAVTGNGAGASGATGRGCATDGGATVDLCECTSANTWSKVDMSCNGGASNVVPVGIVWCELFVGASLDKVNPLWD
jgi:hypothetical protein